MDDDQGTACQEGIQIKKRYGFSPDGDGINDTWIVDHIEEFPNNVVRIYSRSGKLVYEQASYKNTFDGLSNKQSSLNKLPVGAYYFTIELNAANTKPVVGWLYLNY